MKGIVLFHPEDGCVLPVFYRGEIAWTRVDDDVALWASAHSWCLRGRTSGYAASKVRGVIRQLHALIMATPAGFDTDHQNGRSLDNRRANLRVVSRAENNQNRARPPTGKSSQWKGVSWKTADLRFVACIRHGGRSLWLGSFLSELEAARAYDAAASRLFGDFAHLNFPNHNQA